MSAMAEKLRDVLAGKGCAPGSAVFDACAEADVNLADMERLRGEVINLRSSLHDRTGERDAARERARYWQGEAARLRALADKCSC